MNRSHSRGFFVIDVLTGLAIVSALILALAVVSDRNRRGIESLARSRAATALAESTLSDLQLHRQAPPPADARVEVLPLVGGEVIPGKRWVQVHVTAAGKVATLAGLVPVETASPTTAPTTREAR